MTELSFDRTHRSAKFRPPGSAERSVGAEDGRGEARASYAWLFADHAFGHAVVVESEHRSASAPSLGLRRRGPRSAATCHRACSRPPIGGRRAGGRTSDSTCGDMVRRLRSVGVVNRMSNPLEVAVVEPQLVGAASSLPRRWSRDGLRRAMARRTGSSASARMR